MLFCAIKISVIVFTQFTAVLTFQTAVHHFASESATSEAVSLHDFIGGSLQHEISAAAGPSVLQQALEAAKK